MRGGWGGVAPLNCPLFFRPVPVGSLFKRHINPFETGDISWRLASSPMPEDPPFNPYAAPETPVLVAQKPPSVRRPWSVRLALLTIGVCCLIWQVGYWRISAKFGAGALSWNNIFNSAMSLLVFPAGFLCAMIFRRRRITYVTLILLIAFLTWRAALASFLMWTLPGPLGQLPFATKISSLVFLAALVVLLLRIVFGGPSRRYFGLTETARQSTPVGSTRQ